MRSQQDGQVLSYVNDQIRRRYHPKKPEKSGFFRALDPIQRVFCPFWVQQGDASPVPFSRGDCKKKMQPEMRFLLRFRDNVILRNGGTANKVFL